MNTASFKTRIRFMSGFVLFFAFILIAKLFYVQIIHKDDYLEKADKQYSTPSGNILNRGSIFFTKKDGSLVAAGAMMSGFKVAIKTKDVKDPDALYTALSPYTKLERDTFIQKATKKNDPYEEVATHLTKEQADEIKNMKLPGVFNYKEKWRFYPGGSLASQTLGFISYKGDELTGQYGLERFYNTTLSKPKDQAYLNFFAEVFSNIKSTVTGTETGDIVTTIEPTVQQTLEDEMKKTVEKWNADAAGAIIMNPQTGEIYAMMGYPDFDLNEFGKVSDSKVYRNPLVENVLEFGSVMKPLVVAAAIDKGVITPETTYTDTGSLIIEKRQIFNFDKKARGKNTTMQRVLDESLNTGMIFVERQMGHDSFRSYMKSYGIGEKTGIDLPNETSGLIKNLESPRDIEYATASFGQGIALTPIEAVRSFAVLANGGNLVVPHLVKQIRYENGLSKNIEYEPTRTGILKKESTDTITRMLVHVFESYGGGTYKQARYSIATKTGTAQVANPTEGGYYKDKHTHSFFGYFPAYDPKFVVFMFINNPKQVNYASQTLIPSFVNTAKFLLNYYDVPPDR
ncbi:MAG: penicillin-binding protein 2 [Candidatus Pacebacteria bacterium]|nr:penicillin-binding protein 2 [Candidatus Paceibacterota bacterium]MBP9715651.1 penicillin-binding protein 2 [Candidatus Paceibacterota bacterium]